MKINRLTSKELLTHFKSDPTVKVAIQAFQSALFVALIGVGVVIWIAATAEYRSIVAKQSLYTVLAAFALAYGIAFFAAFEVWRKTGATIKFPFIGSLATDLKDMLAKKRWGIVKGALVLHYMYLVFGVLLILAGLVMLLGVFTA
jgi:hypothetical protein